jgi:hypothetical protein
VITDPQNVSGWQVNVAIDNPATPLALGSPLSWWEGLPNALLHDDDGDPSTPERGVIFGLDASGTYRALGQLNYMDAPPWSHSASGTVALANLEFTCQGPGNVVVGLVPDDIPAPGEEPPFYDTRPAFLLADPDTGIDFNNMYMPVEFSNVSVTIHQALQSEWDFSVDEVPGHEAFGFVDSTPAPGTWPHDTLIAVDATPTDPLYLFGYWEATQGTAVPGDPYSPHLEFALQSDVHLLAHFALIPEPMSLGVVGMGLAGLWLRRRRRARA